MTPSQVFLVDNCELVEDSASEIEEAFDVTELMDTQFVEETQPREVVHVPLALPEKKVTHGSSANEAPSTPDEQWTQVDVVEELMFGPIEKKKEEEEKNVVEEEETQFGVLEELMFEGSIENKKKHCRTCTCYNL